MAYTVCVHCDGVHCDSVCTLQGLIYRFSFLMVFTLLCAALTVILFIIGNISEGHWKWQEPTYLEYTSAVQTGLSISQYYMLYFTVSLCLLSIFVRIVYQRLCFSVINI